MAYNRLPEIAEAAGPHEQVLWVQQGNRAGCGANNNEYPGSVWLGCEQPMNPALGAAGVTPGQWAAFLATMDGHIRNYKRTSPAMNALSRANFLIIGVLALFFVLRPTEHAGGLGELVFPLLLGSGFLSMFIYDKQIIKPNKRIDRAIEASLATAFGPEIAARYESRYPDLCKPKHARTQRAFRLSVPGGGLPVGVVVQGVPGAAPPGAAVATATAMPLAATLAPGGALPVAAMPTAYPPAAPLQAEMVSLNPPPAPRSIGIEVPKGAVPGQVVAAYAPTGERVQVAVPAGAAPGTTLTVAY